MKKLFEEISQLSLKDGCTIPEAFCKLSEEFGELAQSVCKTIGKKSHSLTADQIREEIKEECADTIQNVFCVADKYGITYKELEIASSIRQKYELKDIFQEIHGLKHNNDGYSIDDYLIDELFCDLAKKFGKLAQSITFPLPNIITNITEVKEACADNVKSIFSIASYYKISYEELTDMLSKKNAKWKTKL